MKAVTLSRCGGLEIALFIRGGCHIASASDPRQGRHLRMVVLWTSLNQGDLRAGTSKWYQRGPRRCSWPSTWLGGEAAVEIDLSNWWIPCKIAMRPVSVAHAAPTIECTKDATWCLHKEEYFTFLPLCSAGDHSALLEGLLEKYTDRMMYCVSHGVARPALVPASELWQHAPAFPAP